MTLPNRDITARINAYHAKRADLDRKHAEECDLKRQEFARRQERIGKIHDLYQGAIDPGLQPPNMLVTFGAPMSMRKNADLLFESCKALMDSLGDADD